MQEIGSKVVEFFPEGYYRIIALVAFAAIVLNGMWIWAKKEDRKKIGKLVRRSLLICSLAGIAMFIAKLFLNNENTFKVGKTGVLILRILGDDNNSRQVDLIESIRAETRKNSTSSSVQVLASDVLLDDRKIDPVNAHQQARSIGQRLKAQVVIWGNLVDGKKFWPHITVVNTNSPPFASFEQEMNPQNLDQFDLPKELLTEPISLSLFLEAFALYQDGQHAKALKIFESSISFQPTNSPEIAPMLFFSATCRLYLQEKQLDPQKMLDSAVVELRSAADKFGTTNLFPFWEMAENNLGIALQSQSSHSESSNVVNLLIQSVSAFEGAIKSSKEKKFNWTIPAQNLNNTIGKLALLSEGKKATDLLQYAIAQNQELLAVLSHGSDSFSWALTKNNLGVDMRELGSRSAGKDLKNLLTDAVEEFHDSLGVFTRDKYPEFWALVSDNLGNALLVQAEQKGGASSEQLLKQAMQLFKDALQVQTRERSPQKWAWTANNLAAALILESEQANDIEAPILIDDT